MRAVATSGAVAVVFAACLSIAAAQTPAKKKRVSEREVAAAAAALVGADNDAAVAAAVTLGAVKNRSATEPLMRALALGLRPAVSDAAITALGSRADTRSLPVLTYYMAVRRKSTRVAVVRALSTFAANPRVDATLIAALGDPIGDVRAEAATALAARKVTAAAPPMLKLLAGGELRIARAVGQLGDADIARSVAEMIGTAPNEAIAEALGEMLMRSDFGPDPLRVEVVRALGKIPNNIGIEKLAMYVAATPEKPPRASRREAEALVTSQL